MTPLSAGAETRRRKGEQRRRNPNRSQSAMAYAFSSGYGILLLLFGLGPALYAVYLAFTQAGRFAGVDNFARVFADYRFWPAVQHVSVYLVIWLLVQIVFVVFLALIVHNFASRWLSTTARFIYYIPGALAGASSVLLWLFLLDPSVSPVSGILRALGFDSFVATVSLENLPVIFTVVSFWTGAGQWIVIMYGALNNISPEIMEASRVDGAGPIKRAWYIQLPLLRKWISYMVVMSIAAGSQLFVEPRVLSQASKGVVPQDYSLNQLAYLFAFRQNDFNGSAAISLILLAVSLLLAAFFVFRGGLFERD